MASLNKVMLIGNVTADPEIRYLEGDTAQNSVKVARLRLATNDRYRDRKTGEWKEISEFHNISAWRGNADMIEKWVRKGTPLYVEGRIRTRSWTDRDNNSHSVIEILAESVQLLGRRSDAPAAQPKAVQAQTMQSAAAQAPAVPLPPVAPDDDLPF